MEKPQSLGFPHRCSSSDLPRAYHLSHFGWASAEALFPRLGIAGLVVITRCMGMQVNRVVAVSCYARQPFGGLDRRRGALGVTRSGVVPPFMRHRRMRCRRTVPGADVSADALMVWGEGAPVRDATSPKSCYTAAPPGVFCGGEGEGCVGIKIWEEWRITRMNAKPCLHMFS